MRYAELKARTHYSFLQGASAPSEMVERAAALGYAAIGIVDRDGVYGIPKAYSAWKAQPPEGRLGLITGADLKLGEGLPRLTLLAADRAGYGLMCRLLSASHEGKPKGEASLEWVRFQAFMRASEFEAGRAGLFALPEEGQAHGQEGEDLLEALREFFPGKLYLPISRTLDGRDRKRGERVLAQARRLGLPVVATNDAQMHVPDRRRLQDALTAIRETTTLDELGFRAFGNGERYLKSPRQMAALFEDLPEAIWNTVRIAEQCRFSPGELKYRYPSEWIPPGETAQGYLARLVWRGARDRYAQGVPEAVERQLEAELRLISELGYADYFLTIWEIVDFARARKILCQGRGSAANSAVCYCLGITAIDPVKMNLLFERFLSVERGEPPDIDVDFEHERREEVIQHIYERYGRDRAGMVAAVITYRGKSSLREISKALGVEPEAAAQHPYAAQLIEEIQGFPRHLSIHSGGFTLSADPIIETVPIEPARMEGRTIVQWDKDDLAAIGLLKVDVLALGMLSALRKCLDRVGKSLYELPQDDGPTYDMICRGDTIGVFQIESRAQIGMLKRLRPRNFYDLVIEVAIVRPGPIVGQMVHPYLKRRRGLERVDYPHEDLKPILGRTLGVPLFQEQIMKMGMRFAGFTAGEADELRRAFGSWKSTGNLDRMGRKLRKGLLESGLPSEFVERVFQQIQGFSEYGFPESHAASFALLAYASSYLKRHHPAEFTVALLNSQPMGFYSSHSLIDDARRAGVRIRPLDPNVSEWDCTLELEEAGVAANGGAGESAHARARAKEGLGPLNHAIRVGFRVLSGLGETECSRILAERRANGPYRNLADFIYRARVSRPQVLEALAMGEAFACFGLSQRDSLWEVLAYRNLVAQDAERAREGEQLCFLGTAETPEPEDRARFMPLSEVDAIRSDYDSYGLSARGHPMGALRRAHSARNPMLRATTAHAQSQANGRNVRVAGLVIARQRPPTAKGTAFATLEDEQGTLDLILHREVYEQYREIFVSNAFLVVSGRVQVDSAQGALAIGPPGAPPIRAVSLIVRKVEALAEAVRGMRTESHDFH